MKLAQISFGIFLIALIGCKSSYEKVRTSNDAPSILKAANKYYEKEEYIKAQSLYELILTAFRGQKEADEIYFHYAYTHYYLSEFDMASHLFTNYAKTFINSPKKEEADFMAVYSIYKTSPNYKLDQSGTEKAIEGLQFFVNTYPDSKRINECNTLIDELRAKLEKKGFEQGKLYLELRNYQSSVTTFENLLTDYPETKNLREIRYLVTKAFYQLAEKSIFEKQKERYLATIDRATLFLQKFPNGKYVQEVKQIKKLALEKSKNPLYDRYKITSTGN